MQHNHITYYHRKHTIKQLGVRFLVCMRCIMYAHSLYVVPLSCSVILNNFIAKF